MKPKVFTIGFTRSSAEHFFNRLADAGVRKVIDVRVHNTSQLAGFAKSGDLAWFLRELGGIGYEHVPALAPTGEMLKSYRTVKGRWDTYARHFNRLMAEREIERTFQPETFAGACLLCSESTPHQCHRRLVCEYLNEKWGNALTVRHL
jgi:uncharacterized protein (DUF488 family)